jgi:tRNA(Ile)-lysidine synthase
LIHACIVDHGIRPSSEVDGDIAFVMSRCDSLGISLTTAQVPAGHCRQRAKSESRSLEEVAREERHRLLLDVRKRLGSEWVALGHTQDDALETLLMRFIQGSDVGAMAGIPSVRGRLIRPLLGCARQEILNYLRSIGQDWREDTSNLDLSILRNRVRHVLLPLLAKEFPGSRVGILSFSRKAALVAELLREQGIGTGWTDTQYGFSIPVDAFLAKPAAMRAAELMRMFDSLRPPSFPRRLPWRFIVPALGRSLPVGKKSILRGHGVQLVVRDGRLLWERRIVMPCKKSYFIEVSETGSFRVPGSDVRVNFARYLGRYSTAPGETVVLRQDIEPPLVIRSRRRGDQILLEHGATPLKELFAGWKVSEGQRQLVPLLVDRKGIVAVLGCAFGYPSRTRTGALVPLEGDADRIIVRANREHGRGT